jgi:hypothetical protein
MDSDSGSNIPLPKSMQVSDWIKLLTTDFTPDDLDKETAYSLLHYLEDLQLLIPFENDTLKWKELRDGMALKEQIQVMRDGMMRMAHTDIGFAMPFFIGFEKLKLPEIESLRDSKGLAVKNKNTPKPELASDLSNLQIVKKVGRQLKPFLEAETIIVKRLIGKRTSKADARKLFQYMFGRINSKAQPRKWEQLSRKRHR